MAIWYPALHTKQKIAPDKKIENTAVSIHVVASAWAERYVELFVAMKNAKRTAPIR